MTKQIQSIREVVLEAEQLPVENFYFEGIKENTLNLIVAQSKVGKSTLVENLSMTIAADQRDFLGKPVWSGENKRVLLFNMEEYFPGRIARNQQQMQYMDSIVGSSDWQSNVFTAGKDAYRYLDSDEHWATLRDEIIEHRPAVTVIDSLSRTYGANAIEESRTGITLMRKLRELVNDTGTTLLVVHHTHKLGDQPLTLQNMAGSRILAQEADSIIGMNKTSTGIIYMKPLAYRYADDSSERVLRLRRNEHHWLEAVGYATEFSLLRQGDQRTDSTNQDLIMNYFQEKCQGDDAVLIEAAELAAEFISSGKMARATLYSALDGLMDLGYIQKRAKGIYSLITV